ncbi:MAG TPA: hypothetical protein VNB22_06715, partial [Pyrinomonadaceae bacterium]|nr:hypothetical protein [Pyrinomonadaceae bacterium]
MKKGLMMKNYTLNNLNPSRIKSHLRIIGMVFLFNLLLISNAFPQDTVTGAFQGDVSNNQTGDPVVGAEILITNEQTGVVYN